MKKYFLLQPRQSGKTTIAIYEYLKNPSETLFVTHNPASARDIAKAIGGNINNFVSVDGFLNRIRGDNKIKRIILDEYLFFINLKQLYLEISVLDLEELLIFSSHRVLYPEFLFDFVKNNKHLSYHDVCLKFRKQYELDVDIQISELYFNFITDQDTVLIETKLFNRIR